MHHARRRAARLHRIAAACLLAACAASPALATPQAGISGVSVSSDLGSCCGTSLGWLTDGVGLSSYDSAGTYTRPGSGVWISSAGPTGYLNLHLPTAQWVGGLALWNDRFGVATFSLSASGDGQTFSAIGDPTYTLPKYDFSTTVVNLPATVVQLAQPVWASDIRLHVLTRYSEGVVVALGEVMVLPATAPVPEPGTWALMAGGLGLLAWAARRRHAAVRAPAGAPPR